MLLSTAVGQTSKLKLVSGALIKWQKFLSSPSASLRRKSRKRGVTGCQRQNMYQRVPLLMERLCYFSRINVSLFGISFSASSLLKKSYTFFETQIRHPLLYSAFQEPVHGAKSSSSTHHDSPLSYQDTERT